MIKIGEGALLEVGEVAQHFQATHVFIVIGSLLKNGPIRDQLDECIRKQGLKATYFSNFSGEPTTEHLQDALLSIDECKADCIVAIGGGSVIDLAKAVSMFAFHQHVSLDDITQLKKITRLPLIAVPTTAGTGSEATKITVITDVESKVKKNPGHPDLVPDAAILDARLTVSLPKHLTAYTGLDALAHAMEAYVSRLATPLSDFYALHAMSLIGESLESAYHNGEDLKAREKMLLASCYAGIAFSNASTNLAHATARPLGARFDIPHGLSVALTLPFVIEFGLESGKERYANAAKALGINKEGTDEQLAKALLQMVKEYNAIFHIWADGYKYFEGENIEAVLPTLIKDALSGNGIATNQKIPKAHDIEGIYREMFLEIQKHN
nr:iron-containing alcohol dehydrogenase [Cytobacillus eiseniae]